MFADPVNELYAVKDLVAETGADPDLVNVGIVGGQDLARGKDPSPGTEIVRTASGLVPDLEKEKTDPSDHVPGTGKGPGQEIEIAKDPRRVLVQLRLKKNLRSLTPLF